MISIFKKTSKGVELVGEIQGPSKAIPVKKPKSQKKTNGNNRKSYGWMVSCDICGVRLVARDYSKHIQQGQHKKYNPYAYRERAIPTAAEKVAEWKSTKKQKTSKLLKANSDSTQNGKFGLPRDPYRHGSYGIRNFMDLSMGRAWKR